MKPSKDYKLDYLVPAPLKVIRSAIMKVARRIEKFFSFTPVKIIMLIFMWLSLSPVMFSVDGENKILSRKVMCWLIFFSPFTFILLFIFLNIVLFFMAPDTFVKALLGLL